MNLPMPVNSIQFQTSAPDPQHSSQWQIYEQTDKRDGYISMEVSPYLAEVMKLTFGKVEGFPELLGLDSTDPAQIKAIKNQIALTLQQCVPEKTVHHNLLPVVMATELTRASAPVCLQYRKSVLVH